MCDFLLHTGASSPERMARLLHERPGMADREPLVIKHTLATLVVQLPRGRGYEPHTHGGTWLGSVGRPTLRRSARPDPSADSVHATCLRLWHEHGPRGLHERLSGMYGVLRLDPSSIQLLTDQMGFLPVYHALHPNTGALILGTHLEAVAELAGRARTMALDSLAELLIFNHVTFPFTSRDGVTELEPASHFQISRERGLEKLGRFWQPYIGEPFASDDEAIEAVAEGLKEAVADTIHGCDTVAVTLSGGMDSRTLLAAVPPAQRTAALTYISRPNRETSVAAEIAQAAGAEHVLVPRPAEYYSDVLLRRGPALLGTERRAMAHGICVADAGLQDRFDLVLGGQLSDTLLKDHFMPRAEKERLRPRLWRERLKQRLPLLWRRRPPSSAATHGSGLETMLAALRPGFRERIEHRRENRQATVGSLRPGSAAMWSRFWPISRQDDFAHVSGNMRQFSFDSPFMHREIVDLSCRLLPAQLYGGRIANLAFQRIMGPALASIRNANTGLAAQASLIAIAKERRRQRRRGTTVTAPPPVSASRWNDVEGSWLDLRLLQLHSPRWHEHVASLRDSPALDLLASILRGPRGRAVLQYDHDLVPTMNAMASQLATVLDAAMRRAN